MSHAVAEDRQIPGEEPREFPTYIYESVPDPDSSASEFVPVPDRWRQFYVGKWYDPYNQNVLKADIPIFGEPGHEWFFEQSIISETLFEQRRIPVPVGGQSTHHPDSNNTFGDGRQNFFNENLLFSFSLINGATSFKPPEYEFRVTPVLNGSNLDTRETGLVRADPGRGTSRNDNHLGFQELFADIHLMNVSERYDFISSRVGIQRFSSDFRGFVYTDEQPGVRLFGNLDNNFWQYNLAWFSRLEKDTNSGLNTFNDRNEQVAIFNLFRQDALAEGHTLQASVLYRADTAAEEGDHYNNNGALIRPAALGDEREKNIYSTYFGLTGDGHFGRVNSTSALYLVTGSETHNQIAQRQTDILAGMVAQEFSYDVDWTRFRLSFFWASGDHDPLDGDAHGFDAVFDNPNFAGGDLSYWQRQGIPFIGGGGVNLTNRNSLLANLRPGKEEGQSNFVNPGLRLYNAGVDFDITPKLKLITNVSYLQFDAPETVEVLRQDGSISRNIGFDLSAGFLYRPFLNNNVQFQFGASTLLPDNGLDNLFGDRELYTIFSTMILQF